MNEGPAYQAFPGFFVVSAASAAPECPPDMACSLLLERDHVQPESPGDILERIVIAHDAGLELQGEGKYVDISR